MEFAKHRNCWALKQVEYCCPLRPSGQSWCPFVGVCGGSHKMGEEQGDQQGARREFGAQGDCLSQGQVCPNLCHCQFPGTTKRPAAGSWCRFFLSSEFRFLVARVTQDDLLSKFPRPQLATSEGWRIWRMIAKSCRTPGRMYLQFWSLLVSLRCRISELAGKAACVGGGVHQLFFLYR